MELEICICHGTEFASRLELAEHQVKHYFDEMGKAQTQLHLLTKAIEHSNKSVDEVLKQQQYINRQFEIIRQQQLKQQHQDQLLQCKAEKLRKIRSTLVKQVSDFKDLQTRLAIMYPGMMSFQIFFYL